ncbi:MAG: nitroreductase family protein [Acidovorax temperans]|uniref:nitroreductase family protein n=1 Tax=Acidovorax temperans TaxID=80878 RepID=UPI00391B1B83
MNRFRRAIRKFGPSSVSDTDIQELLSEAALAPSSGNLQPYQMHWIRDPSLKAEIALACNGQKAATTASTLIVVVASPALGRKTAADQLAYIDASASLVSNAKTYHRKHIAKFQKILGIGSSAVWTPLVGLLAMVRPGLSLLPIGHIGSRHWAARNAVLAAQTLMLGAASKGIDTCPMEGFSATQVARLLGLPRGAVVPMVIALGYRADDVLEDRWRRQVEDMVVAH